MRSRFHLPALLFKFSLVLLIAPPGTTTARADAPAAADNKPIYVVWRAVGFEKTLSEFYIKNGGHEVSLDIPAFSASQEYAYTGPNPMLIYRKTHDAAPAKPPVPVASVEFDPKCTKAIVFVYPKTDGTLGVRTAPNDDVHFKPGSIRVFNLTTHPVRLSIGDEEQIVDSVHVTIVEPKNQAQSIPIRYALQEQGAWAWKGSNYFSIREGTRRTVVLIHTDAALFRAIGTDGTTSAPTALQIFSFSEQCPPPGKTP